LCSKNSFPGKPDRQKGAYWAKWQGRTKLLKFRTSDFGLKNKQEMQNQTICIENHNKGINNGRTYQFRLDLEENHSKIQEIYD